VLLKSDLKKHSKLNCHDSMIQTIADYFALDVRLYFLDAFGFEYRRRNDNQALESAYIWHKSGEKGHSLLRDYCGLNIDIFKRSLLNSLIMQQIKDSIYNGNPVGVEMDLQYIPWNNLSLHEYRTHYFSIFGYTENNAVCVDNYLTGQMHYYNIDSIVKHANSLYFFKNENQNVHKASDAPFSLILNQLYSDPKYHQMMQLFINDISQTTLHTYDKDSLVELANDEIIYGITNIVWGRIHFQQSLDMLFEFGYRVPISEGSVIDISETWDKIKGLYIKLAYVKDKTSILNRVLALLHIIHEQESHIRNILTNNSMNLKIDTILND